MQIGRKPLVYALLATLLIGSAGVWGIGSMLTRATNGRVSIPEKPAHVVQIDSTDGVRLAGTYWPTADKDAPAILMLHGNGNNRGAMSGTASWLNTHGYAVLAIDFRGHRESTPASKSFGLFESEDAEAALAWLRQNHPQARVGVIGFSLGGAASLLGAKGPLLVDALVLQGVYPDIRRAIFNRLAIRLGRWPASAIEPLLSYQSLPRFGVWPSSISPIRALAQVEAPVLLMGGGKDTNTPPQETRAMYGAIRANAELRILEGVTHDALGRTSPETFPILLAFLDRNLK